MNILYKDIPGYENEYQATTDGRIWSLKSKRFLSQQLRGPENKEYYYVCLCKNNIKKQHRVNRLIAKTFLENPNNLPCVNHKDCNKLNNCVNNLEWCTYEDNNKYNNRIELSVQTRKKNGLCTKVKVYNKNTLEFIGTYESVRDAIKELQLDNSSSANISAALHGKRKSAYGYIWKLHEEKK